MENSLPLNPLELTGVYRECYNQIVKPHRIFNVTRYFLQRWVQLLGVSAAWLVVGLRQYSYWNGRRDWCQISADQLASNLGLHRQRIFEMLDSPWVNWFVWRYGEPHYTVRPDTGRISRTANRYRVAMSEPLVPADAEHLTRWLAEAAGGVTGEPLAKALAAVKLALKNPRGGLLAPAPGPAGTEPSFFHADTPPDILNLVIQAVPGLASIPTSNEGWVELSELCDRLYDHLIEPKAQVLDSQYFRLQWVSRLGTGPAWLVLYLRSLGYCNEERGIYRDTVWVKEMGALAQALGVSKDTLTRSWLKAAGKGAETWRMDWFVKIIEKQKGRDPKKPQLVAIRFRVALRDPLTADDRVRYEEMLASRLEGVSGKTGETNQEVKGNFGRTTGQGKRKNRTDEPNVEGITGHTTSGVKGKTGRDSGGSAEIADDLKYYKHIVSYTQDKEYLKQLLNILQQQFSKKDVPQNRSATHELSFAAVVAPDLETLLQKLTIVGQPRQDILGHEPPTQVSNMLAWHLFTLNEPGLNRNKVGYLVERVRADDPPPTPFSYFVNLSWLSWRVFALANQLTESGSLIIPPEFEDLYQMWCDVYRHVSPDKLPWEVGQGILDVVGDWEILLQPPRPVDKDEPELPSTVRAADVALEDGRTVAAGEVWNAVLEQLGAQMTQAAFDSYLAQSEVVGYKEDQFAIRVATTRAQAWLNGRLRPMVTRALEDVVGRPVEIEFAVERG